MNKFIIRDEKGIMKAKISGHLAGKTIGQAKGHWRDYVTKDGKTVCFEIDEDAVYTIGNNHGELSIYLWTGDVIIPDES